MTFEEEHRRIETNIVQQLLSVLPGGWWSIQLDVFHEREGGADAFPMTISSVDGPSRMTVPPESLFPLVAESHRLFTRNKQGWRRAVYRAWFDEAREDWQFKIEYEYDDAS